MAIASAGRYGKPSSINGGATIFGYRVRDPERYGVVTFDRKGRPLSLEEKPTQPRSNYAVTGLYFYDSRVVEYAKDQKPSARGELEITDLNLRYLREGRLNLRLLGRGVAWLDTGTHESLLRAADFIETVELRQGLKIACLEEIAYREGWIDLHALAEAAEFYGKSGYGEYLKDLCLQFESGEGLLDYPYGIPLRDESRGRRTIGRSCLVKNRGNRWMWFHRFQLRTPFGIGSVRSGDRRPGPTDLRRKSGQS
jgi:hypothetical protein